MYKERYGKVWSYLGKYIGTYIGKPLKFFKALLSCLRQISIYIVFFVIQVGFAQTAALGVLVLSAFFI